MPRVKGAKNIVPFPDRPDVATTGTVSITHLSRATTLTPVEQFKATLRHQRNYLKWIDSRHEQLIQTKAQLNPGGPGPKDGTYRKYRWYSEQITLLETINAFEVFYKTTFVNVACALRRFIPPSSIKGHVDAKVLWINQGKTSFPSLILEHQLYHDLEQVDKTSAMLVDAKRYHPNNINSSMRKLVLALQCIFQIRHTLSHNQGKVTQSDKAKLEIYGYTAVVGEVIDPSKDGLGIAIRNLLEMESKDFTNWILMSTARFLNNRVSSENIDLPIKLKKSLEKLVGSHPDLDGLNWK